jgi:hypothetical protein
MIYAMIVKLTLKKFHLMMSKIKAFFSFEAKAEIFGIVRILFFGIFAYYYTSYNSINPQLWAEMAQSNFWEPQSFFKLFTPELLFSIKPIWFYHIWILSTLMACVGLAFRFAAPISALSFVYLVGLPINFGKIHHANHMPAVIFCIFAFVGSAGAFSMDQLIKKIRKSSNSHNLSNYGWFFATALMYMSLVYCNSGVQKWWESGIKWGSNEAMATIILTRPTVTELGRWVSNSDWLPAFFAWSTLIIQTSSIFMPVSRRLRYLLIPSLFMMHVGTFALLGAHGAFVPYNLCYIVFLPWLLPQRLWRQDPKLY